MSEATFDEVSASQAEIGFNVGGIFAAIRRRWPLRPEFVLDKFSFTVLGRNFWVPQLYARWAIRWRAGMEFQGIAVYDLTDLWEISISWLKLGIIWAIPLRFEWMGWPLWSILLVWLLVVSNPVINQFDRKGGRVEAIFFTLEIIVFALEVLPAFIFDNVASDAISIMHTNTFEMTAPSIGAVLTIGYHWFWRNRSFLGMLYMHLSGRGQPEMSQQTVVEVPVVDEEEQLDDDSEDTEEQEEVEH